MLTILNSKTDSNLYNESADSFDLTMNPSQTSLLNLLLPKSYLNHSLGDLNAVKSGLSTYLLTLNIFEDALENFIQHKYRMFDALVGNNSCYLVSYIILILSKKIKKVNVFLFWKRLRD